MLQSSVQAAASAGVEPPWKKLKPNPSPPSFLSLPDVISLHCLARISKSYYPKLSLVSKTFRSLILSTELGYARFLHKTQEPFFSICLQLPDRPRPSWFILWVQPEKKKATFVFFLCSSSTTVSSRGWFRCLRAQTRLPSVPSHVCPQQREHFVE